ncbi:MAG: alpha/beta hydrolase [Defluviitaleaceae bacterium]|nr:alpha/beta hydrolase [Defluviitaleaceae bacterium]
MKVFRSEKARKNVLDTYDQLLEMWNVDKEERDIPTTYGSTHVISYGNESNPPLVLFHGVGDNSALMWLHNAEALSGHFKVYAVDTIGGLGKSVVSKNYNKNFNGAKWIDEVLAELALDKVYMAGQSMGAYLSQYYAFHRPERILKIVCMAGTVPVRSTGESGSPLKTMMKIFLPEALFPTKKNIGKLLMKLTGKNSAVFTDNPVVMEHYKWLLKSNNMATRFHNISGFGEELVEAIQDKTLYLVGEDDPFMTMGGKDVLLKYKMNVRFFQNVGHGINHEISEEINRLIIEYLR